MRWVLRLQEYDLDIQDRKSEHAGDVDGMTRECPQSTDPYGQGPTDALYEPKFSFTVSKKPQPKEKEYKEEKDGKEERKDVEVIPFRSERSSSDELDHKHVKN